MGAPQGGKVFIIVVLAVLLIWTTILYSATLSLAGGGGGGPAPLFSFPGDGTSLFSMVDPDKTRLDARAAVRRSMRCLDLVEGKVVPKVSAAMTDWARRRATFFLAVQSFANGPEVSGGHFFEAGVAGGPTAVIMASVLVCLGGPNSTIYLADSWEGLQPDKKNFPQDKAFKEGEYHISYDTYKKQWGQWTTFWEDHNEYQVYPWSDINVVEMIGLFKDTMSVKGAFSDLSYLRCDGDMYESTYQCLQYGYPKLLPGGYVYIDDFGAFKACYQSVMDFRKDFNVKDKNAPIYRIEKVDTGDKHHLFRRELDERLFVFGKNDGKLKQRQSGAVEAVFWRKPLDDKASSFDKFPFE